MSTHPIRGCWTCDTGCDCPGRTYCHRGNNFASYTPPPAPEVEDEPNDMEDEQ